MAAQPVIKVVALCGSLRKGSCIMVSSVLICKDSIKGMEIEYVDISALPFLNTDLEVNGTYPAVVEAFRKKIEEADCYLFASLEYNYSVTGPLKNAIDWGGRPPNVWGDKATAVVSAGGGFGGGRSHYHLRHIGIYIDLHFVDKPEFFLNGLASPKFDDEGVLTDEESKPRLREVLLALKALSLRLKGKLSE